MANTQKPTGALTPDAVSEAPPSYFHARVEFYRTRGEDYDTAVRFASEDANARDWALGD